MMAVVAEEERERVALLVVQRPRAHPLEGAGQRFVEPRTHASHTVTVPRVSADIRDRVIAVLSRHVSVDPGAVNIVVEDVYDA